MLDIIVFSRYDKLGASSRVRFFQYKEILNKNGINYIINPLISDNTLANKYINGRYSIFKLFIAYLKRVFQLIIIKKDKLIIIEKELFPNLPYLFEKIFLRNKKYILDYDDPVFLQQNNSSILNFLLNKKYDNLNQKASLIFVGNPYLESFAKLSNNKNIIILPSVIDLDHYKNIKLKKKSSVITIVWIGSPATKKYLKSIFPVLEKLNKKHDFIFKIVGIKKISKQKFNVKTVPWKYSTEANEISMSDIGIMPLDNTPWAEGKCGYKLIQYMACGLPVVGSDIGVNNQIIDHGINGFLTKDKNHWFEYLSLLITNPELRDQFGDRSLEKVKNIYNIKTQSKIILSSINSIFNEKQ